jgi:hypothetical protein
MIKLPIKRDRVLDIFIYALLFCAVYLLYATYQLYQFHSHEKHLKKIHITTEFIPKELCGDLFKKDEITLDEDLENFRRYRREANLNVAMKNYYLGYTVVNKSDKPISELIIATDIFFPYDEKINPMNYPNEDSVGFFSKNGKLLQSGQYFRRCMPILLNRDYSEIELYESRRISKIERIQWGN